MEKLVSPSLDLTLSLSCPVYWWFTQHVKFKHNTTTQHVNWKWKKLDVQGVGQMPGACRTITLFITDYSKHTERAKRAKQRFQND